MPQAGGANSGAEDDGIDNSDEPEDVDDWQPLGGASAVARRPSWNGGAASHAAAAAAATADDECQTPERNGGPTHADIMQSAAHGRHASQQPPPAPVSSAKVLWKPCVALPHSFEGSPALLSLQADGTCMPLRASQLLT